MKYVRMDNEKHCLECGTSITYGREDKRFCSCGCKNTYHNRVKAVEYRAKFRIQAALDKNYKILDSLIKKQIRSIDRTDLSILGYRDEYITSYRKIGSRTECRCYNIKFSITPSKISSIEKVSTELP